MRRLLRLAGKTCSWLGVTAAALDVVTVPDPGGAPSEPGCGRQWADGWPYTGRSDAYLKFIGGRLPRGRPARPEDRRPPRPPA